MPLLNVSHRQQPQEAECLAACAAMVLDYLQVPFRYERLLALLRVQFIGARFSNLQQLESLSVSVLVERGEIETLRLYIDQGLPPIVLVATGQLSYWNENTGHAVVVVGLEENLVHIYDPAFSDAPKKISVDEFMLAWIDADRFYAILKLE